MPPDLDRAELWTSHVPVDDAPRAGLDPYTLPGMTISSFCLNLLTEQGTLSLDQLGAAAAQAGVTLSSNPQQSVRAAIRNRAVPLPGDRWAAPLRLLEGRCLTTRTFSQYDLSPLERVCRHNRVPLAEGGFIREGLYGGGLTFPKGFTDRQGLTVLRVLNGVVQVEQIDDSPDIAARGASLGASLPPGQRYGYDLASKEEVRLWALLERDAELLRHPTTPLSECLPSLADLVQEEQGRRERNESMQRYGDYRPTAWISAEIPTSVLMAAEDRAGRSGQLLEEWVRELIEREVGHIRGLPLASSGDVLAFPDRWRG